MTVIVTSYNYASFLKEAVDSALNQTHPGTEVIVVDDGSTDGSREIIASYGERIIAIHKSNAGQASAFNAGFLRSKGEVIVFLDSDDALSPVALQHAVAAFGPKVSKVHWPLWEVDQHGTRTGKVEPAGALAEGDLFDEVVRHGPDSYVTPPTTGNAWARTFLEAVLPMPEEEYRTCPDGYLATLAPLFGSVRRLLEPQGVHRVHNKNALDKIFYADKRRMFDHRCGVLARYLRERGIEVAPETWTKSYYTWLRQIESIELELAELLSPQDRFILVDQDELRREFPSGRRAFPFLERDGQYWGAPPDDDTAIREVDRLRAQGARLFVVAWPAFWWLQHYAHLHRHLRSTYPCILHTEHLVVFQLDASLISTPVELSAAIRP